MLREGFSHPSLTLIGGLRCPFFFTVLFSSSSAAIFHDNQGQSPASPTSSTILRDEGRCEIAVLAPVEVGAQEAPPDPLGHRGMLKNMTFSEA